VRLVVKLELELMSKLMKVDMIIEFMVVEQFIMAVEAPLVVITMI